MLFVNTPVWELEVSAQGDHSTDVDTDGIKIFLQHVAAKQLFDYINQGIEDDGIVVNFSLVRDTFFSRGIWKLNMERKQLFASNHYHAGTFRVYEETGFRGLRVVVHLPSGQRRYGHLHPPREMKEVEATEACLALHRCFSDPISRRMEAAYVGAYNASKKADPAKKRFPEEKREAQSMVRAYDHTYTIFRSREKKTAFAEHLWKASGEGTLPLPRASIIKLLEHHWIKFRGDSRIAFNDTILTIMLGQARVYGLSNNPQADMYVLGEYGEILVNDRRAENEKRQRLLRDEEIRATEKLVQTLSKREVDQRASLQKTQAELASARQKLSSLQSIE